MARFCFSLAAWLGGLGLTALLAAPLDKITSVVRVDPRSGRLVRTIVVPSRLVPQREVKPRVVPPVEPGGSVKRQAGSDLDAFVEEMGRRYDIDPLLVHSVIRVESDYNPWAVSPKGAQGLMQLMPGTARRLSVANTFDPSENIEGGVRYLKYLLTLFGDERLALAAYNAGEGAVFRYGNIPPYRETNEYVYRVGKKMGEARRAAERKRRAASEARPRIEEFVDSAGRLHIRTKMSP